jgi:hypothetical protein
MANVSGHDNEGCAPRHREHDEAVPDGISAGTAFAVKFNVYFMLLKNHVD